MTPVPSWKQFLHCIFQVTVKAPSPYFKLDLATLCMGKDLGLSKTYGSLLKPFWENIGMSWCRYFGYLRGTDGSCENAGSVFVR